VREHGANHGRERGGHPLGEFQEEVFGEGLLETSLL